MLGEAARVSMDEESVSEMLRLTASKLPLSSCIESNLTFFKPLFLNLGLTSWCCDAICKTICARGPSLKEGNWIGIDDLYDIVSHQKFSLTGSDQIGGSVQGVV